MLLNVLMGATFKLIYCRIFVLFRWFVRRLLQKQKRLFVRQDI